MHWNQISISQLLQLAVFILMRVFVMSVSLADIEHSIRHPKEDGLLISAPVVRVISFSFCTVQDYPQCGELRVRPSNDARPALRTRAQLISPNEEWEG